MNSEIFNQQHIIFEETAKTQDEVFRKIAEVAYEQGFVSSVEEFYKGLLEREEESTTGFKDGIAIPHSKNHAVLKPGMFLMKFSESIEWNALDKQPVRVAFALTI